MQQHADIMGVKQKWHVKNVTLLHLADGLVTKILKQVSSSPYYCQRRHERIRQLDGVYHGPFGSNLGDSIHSFIEHSNNPLLVKQP
jgi:hypothetical protein